MKKEATIGVKQDLKLFKIRDLNKSVCLKDWWPCEILLGSPPSMDGMDILYTRLHLQVRQQCFTPSTVVNWNDSTVIVPKLPHL